MTPIILDRPRSVDAPVATPAPDAYRGRRAASSPPEVAVGVPAPRADGSAPLVFSPELVLSPESWAGLSLGASRADVVRLGFSSAVPSVTDMARLVAAIEAELAAIGRDRAEVRIALDVEVVLATDDATARRKRSHLDFLDALAGLTWNPAGTRVVAGPAGLVDAAVRIAERVGVDEVVLVPLSGSAAAQRLRELLSRGVASGHRDAGAR